MRLNIPAKLCLAVPAIALALMGGAPRALAAPAPTTTTLAITAGGSVVSTVSSGTVVTLTATVVAGTAPVTTGQVRFCDAAALHCEDSYIAGLAQLTGASTASISFRAGVGSHSYNAVFMGTGSDAGSASANASLTVLAPTGYVSETAIAQSGTPGNYTLSATVGGAGPAPSGTISFLDTSQSNAVLGTAPLSTITGLGLVTSPASATEAGVNQMAVADFNGDGIPDMALITQTGGVNNSIVVLLGKGDGTFSAVADSATASQQAISIVTADFNGDGIPDLAFLNNGAENQGNVLLGNGDGTFRAIDAKLGSGQDLGLQLSMVVGDFNQDGIPDLAIVAYNSGILSTNGNPQQNGAVSIFLGVGDGTFNLETLYVLDGYNSRWAVVGDFNGDGFSDLAILNQVGNTSILLGKGDGTFSTATPDASSASSAAFVSADFNGDGLPDLAFLYPCNAQSPCPGTIGVFLNNGDGTFTTKSGFLPAGIEPQSLFTGDLNGDGIPDLITSNMACTYDATQACYVSVMLGNGDGTFAPATAFPYPYVSGVSQVLGLGDFNGDGVTDLGVIWSAADQNQSLLQQWTIQTMLSEPQSVTASISGVAVLPAGSGAHPVVASYPGGGSYAASTSQPTTLAAVKATPTLGLGVSPDPARYGAQVTLTATLTASGAMPTGSVSFYDGTKLLGTGAVNTSGVASYASGTLAVGPHSITADYSGDSNNIAVNSAATSLTVNAGGTPAIALKASANSITFGSQVIFTATVTAGGSTPTGIVTFLDGTATLGQGMLDPSGATSLLTATLAVGQHSITASYAGDANYNPIVSTAVSVAVAPPITPAITVTPSSHSITPQQGVAVTVTVSGTSGNPTPSGSVTLSGGGYLGQALLAGGQASFSIPAGTLALGSDTLTAAYAGAAPYGPVSGTTNVVVGKITPTVAVAPGASTMTTVQSLTVTVTVSGPAGAPAATGSVILSSGSYTSAAAPLSGGSASISIAAGALAVGTDTLMAAYTPDSAASATYLSASGTGTITVNKSPVTVTAAPSSSAVTTVAAFTVTVTVTGGAGTPAATGKIVLGSGSYLSSAATLANGSVTITVPAGALGVGADTVNATYTPDAAAATTYNGGFTSFVENVSKAPSTTTAKPSAASESTAQPLTITVTVTGGAGDPAPTGTATLSGGGYTSAATALSSGAASIVVPAGKLAIGSDSLTVAYSGDTVYLASSGSTSVTVSAAIGTATSSVKVTPASLFITNQQTDAVAITVSGAGGQPTGTVTLQSGTYSAQQTLSAGAASITIPAGALPAGPDTITASYSGDGTYATASGTAVVTVSELVSNASGPSSVSPGGNATPQVTVTAGSTYSGTLDLACKLTTSPSGAVSLPTCTLNPATLSLSAGGSGKTALTVATTAASSASLAVPSRKSLWGLGGGGAVLAMLFLCGIPARRRRFAAMLALLWVAVVSLAIGCGGGGGGGQTGSKTGPAVPATTAGSYVFTVTGTDASNAAITTSTTVGVTVQ